MRTLAKFTTTIIGMVGLYFLFISLDMNCFKECKEIFHPWTALTIILFSIFIWGLFTIIVTRENE